EECEEAYWTVKTFGEYEVRETESGEYEVVKGGIIIGTFSEARVEKERIIFSLSRGTLLEVSEEGIREITTPEKAKLLGMIASDGSNTFRREPRSEGGYRTEYSIRFYSEDRELIMTFDEMTEKTYGMASHHYTRKRNGLITAAIYSKGVFYDLSDLGLKTGPYKFHVPRGHLDAEGKRMFLRGFFSGDGSVSISGCDYIRFYSKCKEGLEELRQILMDIGFHPHEIRFDEKPAQYSFSLPREDYLRFIEEIGSDKPSHVSIFEEMKRKIREEEDK
ncbi:MAG: LAGLIDADG family homing endonuclease, partial [Thermoproteota archaeon]